MKKKTTITPTSNGGRKPTMDQVGCSVPGLMKYMAKASSFHKSNPVVMELAMTATNCQSSVGINLFNGASSSLAPQVSTEPNAHTPRPTSTTCLTQKTAF